MIERAFDRVSCMSTPPTDLVPMPLGAALRRAADLVEAEPEACSVAELREAVALHAELAGRLEAEAVRWVGAFDVAGVAACDASHSTAAWIATRTELDRRHAGALVLRARDLRACPAVAAAYADGRLGSAKVRPLLEARTTYPEKFAEHEADLVERLVPMTVAHARIAIAHWRTIAQATREFDEAEAARAAAAADGLDGAESPLDDQAAGGPDGGGGPCAGDHDHDGCGDGDGSEQRRGAGIASDPSDAESAGDAARAGDGGGESTAEGAGGAGRAGGGRSAAGEEPPPDPAASNELRLSQTFQGRWVLDGDFDPVSGAELAEALQAFVDQQFRQGTYRTGDGRSAGFRRAEALVELVLRGGVAATRHGDPRPSVIVRIDPATLAGVPADDLTAGLERDCSLDDGTPIDARSIERLLCTARIQALWTRIREDGTVETLGVTDLLRDATRAQRRALKQRDGRCVFPGCGAAAEWCDAHHLIPNEDLGPTLLANLALLCRFHHHLVHEGGWTLWRDEATGALHLIDPDGHPRPIGQHGEKQPVLHPERSTTVRPPPTPPHLRPPRFSRPGSRQRPPDPPGSSTEYDDAA
jgi:hypothetical protein